MHTQRKPRGPVHAAEHHLDSARAYLSGTLDIELEGGYIRANEENGGGGGTIRP